jgi:hypothetical protein
MRNKIIFIDSILFLHKKGKCMDYPREGNEEKNGWQQRD